jgi:hypothetical protein
MAIPKNATILVGMGTSGGGISNHEPEDRVLLVTVIEVIFICIDPTIYFL